MPRKSVNREIIDYLVLKSLERLIILELYLSRQVFQTLKKALPSWVCSTLQLFVKVRERSISEVR